MKQYFENNKIKVGTILLILILSIIRISTEKEIYPTGDAVEYTLMTEALYNHGSADIRYSDYESFKELFLESNKWETNPKALFYDEIGDYLANTQLKQYDYYRGIFVDDKGVKYSCHFFAYSLFNIPMRWVCKIVQFNPLLIHQFTNILLLLITCFFFFKYSSFGEFETMIFVILFFYSANYWYLSWQHPEIFTTCFASLGFWLFMCQKRYYLGILLISVAALQNEPVIILIAALCIITLFIKGFNIKNILLTGLSSVLVLLPPAFYYFHFRAINLIEHADSIKSKLVTFNRVFGFFFDINQGAILAIPFILLVYVGLLIRKLILIKGQEKRWELLIPLGLIGAVCFAASIDNWNSGQAVVNRYVTYISGIIIMHCFFLVIEIKNKRVKWSILSFSLVTQLMTVYYHQSLTKYDWSGNDPKPISNWVLENYPQYYNPDPTIFINRYGMLLNFDISQAPAYYMKANGEITKFLVHKDYLWNLINFGFTQEQIEAATSNLSYTNDWAYINVDKKFKSSFPRTKLKLIDYQRRVLQQIRIIKDIPDWYQVVKLKALKYGIDEEEMIRRDAAYVISSTIEISGTKEEIIFNKIIEINANKDWYNKVKEKAKEANITVDSAIVLDATFIAEEGIKKRKELK